MASLTKKESAERQECIEKLRELCPPGSTVYSVLRHVSSSGMSRRIDFYTIADNRPVFLSGYIARVLGYKRHKSKDGLTVSGAGMDMGFSVVYNLSAALYGHDNRGGYSISHQWM